MLTLTRVLCIVGFVVVCAALLQRRRCEQFLVARASKPVPNPRGRFWRWTTVGAVFFALLPAFSQRCTGVRLPLLLNIIPAILGFALFVAMVAVAYFVTPVRYARDPRRSVRTGFVCIALAGVLFLAAIYLEFAR